jgi:hypothetical protein
VSAAGLKSQLLIAGPRRHGLTEVPQLGLVGELDMGTSEGIFRMLDRQSPAERLVDGVFSKPARIAGETYLEPRDPCS